MSGVFYIGLGDRFGGSNVVQRKTDKALWIPMHPELVDVLEATQRRGEFVVLTQHGRPFSVKALGMRMQAWARAAGLPPGHTLHGLRKSLGKMLAESGPRPGRSWPSLVTTTSRTLSFTHARRSNGSWPPMARTN